MSLIKDVYSEKFYLQFSASVSKSLPLFDKKKFMKLILSPSFYEMEWKERMKHTTVVFHQFLSKDFKKAAKEIQLIIGQIQKDGSHNGGLAHMFFPDYVETYGLNDFKTSVKLFEFITKFISCEFAVRPFLLKYDEQMLEIMQTWALSKDAAVRRLASEGSRPRLPWAMAIPFLKNNPSGVLPILNSLVEDDNEIVRRSVANNLNDISKDHSKVVLDFCKKWKGKNKQTDALLKHACRTMLKQGNPKALEIFGYNSSSVQMHSFDLKTKKITIGDYLEFSFTLINELETPKLVRLEYGIYYQKQSGNLAKKVYKISERIYGANESIKVDRRQSFKQISTRRFHKGLHQISIIINGEEKELFDFHLQ